MRGSLRALLAVTAVAGLLACDSTSAPVQLQLHLLSGDQQVGGAGAQLPQPVVVRVTDVDGQPVKGATVVWRTLEGGGSVTAATTVTDTDGRTSVEWTLGNDLGPQVLLATSATATLNIRATGTFRLTAVAAGFRHTCALATTGAVFCWGANQQGQLGNGSEVPGSTPVRVQTHTRLKSIVAGWSHTCALTLAGEALCWGDNSVGQAGLASGAARSAAPAAVTGNDAFVAISVGFAHSCALTAAGDAVCWGENSQGQLGGAQPARARISGQQFRAISAGEFHTCAITSNRAALCWGWNSIGELGTGAAAGAIVSVPAIVAGNLDFADISAGVRHTCAITTGGQAYCWGRNAAGETGQDPFVHAATPNPVAGGVALTAIGTGNTHTCARAAAGAYCWGSAPANGTSAPTSLPAQLSAQLAFTSLSVGYAHTCGVAAGEVWCWGSNSHGQLGQSTVAESAAPVRVQFTDF